MIQEAKELEEAFEELRLLQQGFMLMSFVMDDLERDLERCRLQLEKVIFLDNPKLFSNETQRRTALGLLKNGDRSLMTKLNTDMAVLKKMVKAYQDAELRLTYYRRNFYEPAKLAKDMAITHLGVRRAILNAIEVELMAPR